MTGASKRSYAEGWLTERSARLRIAIDGYLATSDPEDLHDIRVELRRVRSYLRAARRSKPELRSLDSDLRWLARGFGGARDLDVQIELVERVLPEMSASGQAGAARVLSSMKRLRGLRRANARRRLRSQRCRQAIEHLVAFAENGARAHWVTTPDALAGEARRNYRISCRYALEIGENPAPEELHKLRTQIRRLRYNLEAANPRDGSRLRWYIRRLTVLQDILGDHQDIESLKLTLQEVAATFDAHDGTVRRVTERIGTRVDRKAAKLRNRVPKALKRVQGRSWKRARRDLRATLMG